MNRSLTGLEVNPRLRASFLFDRWGFALYLAGSTGASDRTAKRCGLMCGGLTASQHMARADLHRVLVLKERFVAAGACAAIPASLLAAIASRESRCGKILAEDGIAGNPDAWGIMQLDRRHFVPMGDADGFAHIKQTATLIAYYLNEVNAKHPQWRDKDVLKGALVAYNSGLSNVKTIARMDIGTTNNDYGSDVIARAKFYSRYL